MTDHAESTISPTTDEVSAARRVLARGATLTLRKGATLRRLKLRWSADELRSAIERLDEHQAEFRGPTFDRSRFLAVLTGQHGIDGFEPAGMADEEAFIKVLDALSLIGKHGRCAGG